MVYIFRGILSMNWIIELHPDFAREFLELSPNVQDALLIEITVLEEFGPQLGRPSVDTLKASKYSNMKELRFDADDGVWRAAFAFDPQRKAIILVAGDKSGVSQKRFYKTLLNKADARFERHLNELKDTKK